MRKVAVWTIVAAGLASCGGEKTPEAAPCAGGPGIACIWAGTGEIGYNGDGHDKLKTVLYDPFDVTFDAQGTPYFIDWNNYMIRRVKPDNTVETVIGTIGPGDGPPTDPPDVPGDLTPGGAPGTSVKLNHPTQIVFGPDGTMFLDSWHNHKIRTWDPATGLVHVMCGRGGGFAGDGGPAAKALFNQPKAIALGPTGELYILDQRNERLRKVDAGSNPNISTILGTGKKGYSDETMPLDQTPISLQDGDAPEPQGALALTRDGKTLYLADTLNNRIRQIDLEAGSIKTIAGTGEAGYSGEDGPALQAQLNLPRDLQLSADESRLYVADTDNNRIRVMDLTTGVISLVAGSGEPGNKANVPAKEAQLNHPFGIALDAHGDLFIADSYNGRILEVQP